MAQLNLTSEFVSSWRATDGNVNSTADILAWVAELNNSTQVAIAETSVDSDSFWFYDDYAGEILNRKRAFFSIKGMRLFEDGQFVREQPIIFQQEIGYLGIACRMIDGVLNFLMQAKIEPGNLNCVQISPTIQATKSNFLRAHGGQLPAYFDMFANAAQQHTVIYDQIQSEQATRFFRKRNRNMIILVDDEFEVLPNFRWMTLGQIKELLKHDNLVNMDARTVLSGIPLATGQLSEADRKALRQDFSDDATYRSWFDSSYGADLPNLYQSINDFKMFRDVQRVPVPLNQLVDWTVDDYGITCKAPADFDVRYYNIEISGREVRHWMQPLFRALGEATFVLVSRVHHGMRQFLIRATPEIGAFDKVEFGPTVQWEPTHNHGDDDEVERLVAERLMATSSPGMICDVMLSEEGGRFYHEQNRNVVLEVAPDELTRLPTGYHWVDLYTLNLLAQVNNQLNIQLRNLISLLPL